MPFSSAPIGRGADLHNDRPRLQWRTRLVGIGTHLQYPRVLQALGLVIHHHCSDDALEPRGDRGCAAMLVARKSDTHSRAVEAVDVNSLALQRGGQTPQRGAQTFTECQPYLSHRDGDARPRAPLMTVATGGYPCSIKILNSQWYTIKSPATTSRRNPSRI